jgi:AAA15 family ATPase/GTPase
MTKNMKFSFDNLGALDSGELEIADLTIICGANNTGKTYLTYTFYGLLKHLVESIKLPDIDFDLLRQSGVLEINLEEEIVSKADAFIEKGVNTYRKNLHRVLAAQEERFEKTNLHLDINLSTVLQAEYRSSFSTDQNRRILEFSKPKDSVILTITSLSEVEPEKMTRFTYDTLIERVIKEICFARALLNPFIISTERTGAVTFQSELNLAKNRLINMANKITGGEMINPIKLFEEVYTGGYPLPVKDNVEFINALSAIQVETSSLLKENPEILGEFENLIGGSYRLQSDGTPHFVPNGTRGVKLGMGESSSSVRSLVLLGYYLKHRARSGDLLIMDEPELNLHPANQRRLARLLVRLVHVGIKVFVTTHSDYLVKEFNTLIMLNRESADLDVIREKYGYTSQDRLDYNRVNLYMLRDSKGYKKGRTGKTNIRTLSKATIHPTLGIEVESFDETINEMNALQHAIYYSSSGDD